MTTTTGSGHARLRMSPQSGTPSSLPRKTLTGPVPVAVMSQTLPNTNGWLPVPLRPVPHVSMARAQAAPDERPFHLSQCSIDPASIGATAKPYRQSADSDKRMHAICHPNARKRGTHEAESENCSAYRYCIFRVYLPYLPRYGLQICLFSSGQDIAYYDYQ
ncbi:hypothetical protein IAQ61_010933 [Plenodomus lingam]|uniref:uncharacterized protein n=1 Tax=Leptosphaeria maculans TaxID=5022 RepID=UPI00332AD6A0|nr:hypothetical protein IAQ61_010933 [Plenodomus lingam]